MSLAILVFSSIAAIIGLMFVLVKASQREFVSLGGMVGASFMLSGIAFGIPAYLGYIHPEANPLVLLAIAASIILVFVFAGCTGFFLFVQKEFDRVVGFALMSGLIFYALFYLIDLVI